MTAAPEPTLTGWLTTAHAEALTGYAAAYLRRLAGRGRIVAQKVGRDWLIQQESLVTYQAQMTQLGRQRHNPWRPDLRGQGLGRGQKHSVDQEVAR